MDCQVNSSTVNIQTIECRDNRENQTREKHLENKWVVRVVQSALVLSLVLATTILRASENTDIGTARLDSEKCRDLQLVTYYFLSVTFIF